MKTYVNYTLSPQALMQKNKIWLQKWVLLFQKRKLLLLLCRDQHFKYIFHILTVDIISTRKEPFASVGDDVVIKQHNVVCVFFYHDFACKVIKQCLLKTIAFLIETYVNTLIFIYNVMFKSACHIYRVIKKTFTN